MQKSESPFPPRSWQGIDDVVIVGGGLAGLFCALKLAPRPVTILTAAPVGEGASSAWAQGGIAAAVGPGDTVDKHVADTIAAGDGLVDEKIAWLMASEAADRIHDLLDYGVPFDRDLDGALKLSREAAHSERRIVHVRGDMAGRAIMSVLEQSVAQTPSIQVLEGFVAERVVTEGGFVTGLVARDRRGGLSDRLHMAARAIVLCTGGIGHLYAVTTNPPEARGEGMAIAARAGATIADAEFVQFHPTAVDAGIDPAPLATEALRGEGAHIIDRSGKRFMLELHPDGELAPRDIVARGVQEAVNSGRGAFLDCRKAIGSAMPEEFPTVYGACMAAGIDPTSVPIPIAPAAHYHMGGVHVDGAGRSSVTGLWACGEVASTGAHGANRLASNSLLEAVVFAARIAEDIQAVMPNHKIMRWPDNAPEGGLQSPEHDEQSIGLLRRIMSQHVGVVRNRAGLETALAEIETLLQATQSPQARNALIAGKLVTRAALSRTESRGGHYRSDCPDTDKAQTHRTYMRLDDLAPAMPVALAKAV